MKKTTHTSVMLLRCELAEALRKWIDREGITQAQAARTSDDGSEQHTHSQSRPRCADRQVSAGPRGATTPADRVETYRVPKPRSSSR